MVNYLYPIDAKTQVYLIACLYGLVFVFLRLETSLVQEMRLYFQERRDRERIEREAEAISRDAAIGNAVRSLTHEINNLTGIATLTAGQLRSDVDQDQAALERIDRLERALAFMTRISTLVLDDLGGRRATRRRCSLERLAANIRLLIGGPTCFPDVQTELDLPSGTGDVGFIERTGSTYLIIHNIAKNGYETIRERHRNRPGGILRITARIEPRHIVLSVTDNGVGMSDRQVEDILDGNVASSKRFGHGLGIGFVLRECRENGYGLTVDSTYGSGSRFAIRIPRDDRIGRFRASDGSRLDDQKNA